MDMGGIGHVLKAVLSLLFSFSSLSIDKNAFFPALRNLHKSLLVISKANKILVLFCSYFNEVLISSSAPK